jgi:hypothetical protein
MMRILESRARVRVCVCVCARAGVKYEISQPANNETTDEVHQRQAFHRRKYKESKVGRLIRSATI